ncbi:MAG: iron hydrogenase small subunit, partial [Bacteroidota bacterium]|nr:iron hydrogenase small subunit [Bacteroidota bacterium]
KEALMKIGNTEVKIGVVSGLKNVKHFLEEVKNGTSDLLFIEVMACPGGCINGGGQPVEQETDTLIARMRALYTIDKQENLRTSHENPFIQQLYREYLGEPLSEKSHHLLHTRYLDRSDLE